MKGNVVDDWKTDAQRPFCARFSLTAESSLPLIDRADQRIIAVMDDDAETRLEKIESSLAHLEHQYDQLNQIVIRQEKILGRLQTVMERIDGTLRDFELNQVRDHNAKPPHYGDPASG